MSTVARLGAMVAPFVPILVCLIYLISVWILIKCVFREII